MGLSAMNNGIGAEELMRMSNHSGYGSYIDPNAWTGEQTLGVLGLGDDTLAGLSDMNNGGDWAPAINQLTTGITSIISATKNKKNRAAPAAKNQMQQMPANMPMSAEHEGGFMGMSSKTMLLVGLGALALIGLIILMSKKKKRGDDKDDHHE